MEDEPTMDRRHRTTLFVCALLAVGLAAAPPALATATEGPTPASGDEAGPCVMISTDPPDVGVYTRCPEDGSSGPIVHPIE